ncbi:uncharacterized protein VTP21DRAFT_6211 [Calcarisporiella thermophila]|uniref:uncharacterized protein n=1 Tax=Calcarisporiella thermophila TaxID=911321 RepID=UPI003741FEA0
MSMAGGHPMVCNSNYAHQQLNDTSHSTAAPDPASTHDVSSRKIRAKSEEFAEDGASIIRSERSTVVSMYNEKAEDASTVISTEEIKENKINKILEEAHPIDQNAQEDVSALIDSPRGWFVVLSAFLANVYCFGCTYLWGIYQEHYLTIVFPGEYSTLQISFVGSLATALLLSFGVFIEPIIHLLGHRGTVLLGAFFCVVGYILCSFATTLWQIFLTQGLILGTGYSLAFFPTITLPPQWFNRRRGLATGIAMSGGGIGGLAFSPLIQRIIELHGYRWSLRTLALIGLILLSVSAFLARPLNVRPPKRKKVFDSKVVDKKVGLLLGMGFFVSFGFIAPFFFLNGYSQFIGLSPALAATLTGCMSGVNSVARILIGFFADYFGRVNALLWCNFLAGVVTMLVWPLSTNLSVLIIFVILYGSFGGGYASLLPVVIADIVPREHITASVGMIYSISCFGYLFGTPIAGALLDANDRKNYVPVAEYTGSMTLLASFFLLALRLMLGKNIFKKL